MGNRYVIDWKAYAGTAVKAAAEGAVLLKEVWVCSLRAEA